MVSRSRIAHEPDRPILQQRGYGILDIVHDVPGDIVNFTLQFVNDIDEAPPAIAKPPDGGADLIAPQTRGAPVPNQEQFPIVDL